MVTSKKTDIQKQKQKRAKQQQQQQQKQNVKINIRLGEKPSRKRRAPGKKQPPRQPPKPPPDLPVQFPMPQYVPMFINQYPSPYFTAPTPSSTITSVSAPTSAISSILPSTPSTLPITTPPVASLPPPIPPTFRPPPPARPTIKPITYFSDFGTQTQEPSLADFGTQTRQPSIMDFGTQTLEPSIMDFGTQTQQPFSMDFGTQTQQPFSMDFGMQTEQPSAISETLRGMEMPRAQPPPPLERAQTEPTRPPLPFLKDFVAPTQDIQASGIQQFVSLTPESLSNLGGISSDKKYAPSEISGITDTSEFSIDSILEQIRSRSRRQPENIEETLAKKKAEKELEKNIREESKRQQMQERSKAAIEKIELERQDKIKKIEEEQRKLTGILAEIEKAGKEREAKKSQKIISDLMDEITGEVEKRNEEPEMTFPRKKIEPGKKLKPPSLKFEEEEEEPVERKPIEESKRIRKPGSGRPKGSGNKSEIEKESEQVIKEESKKIRKYEKLLKELRNGDYETDEAFDEASNKISEYENEIEQSLGQISMAKQLIDEEINLRKLPTISEEEEPIEVKVEKKKKSKQPKFTEEEIKEGLLTNARTYRRRLKREYSRAQKIRQELDEGDLSVKEIKDKQNKLKQYVNTIRIINEWFEEKKLPIQEEVY